MRLTVLVALAALASADVAKRAALDDCLAAANVPVDERGSEAWEADAAPFNQRFNYTPAAIAVPSKVQDVQAAVSCAAAAGIKVNAKSGGHSYAGFGLGGEDGHLVVELDRMNRVEVDADSGVATVQAGARLGHVAIELFNQSQRAISHGTCPGVGIGGHALHGGYGFSSYTHGLALDWIRGATVVLANGSAVECSETENADLFWALRGAGSSFGVVTSFRFATFAAPSNVTVFSASTRWTNADEAVAGLSAFQDWAQDSMPAEMNVRLFGISFGTSLQGVYHGERAAFDDAVAPLLAALNATLLSARETGWMEAFEAYANGDTIDVSHPYNLHETFFAKSLVTKALPEPAIKAAVDYWFDEGRSMDRIWYIILDLYGGRHSGVSKVPGNSTSYAHRDKLWLMQLYDRVPTGPYPDDGFAFLDIWVDSITAQLDPSDWGMYINYADPTMTPSEAQENYWRQNLPKLKRIKTELDPDNVIYYPQGVGAV